MLVYWIPETNHTLPSNASHRVGVAAFVVNSKGEVDFLHSSSTSFLFNYISQIKTCKQLHKFFNLNFLCISCFRFL